MHFVGANKFYLAGHLTIHTVSLQFSHNSAK